MSDSRASTHLWLRRLFMLGAIVAILAGAWLAVGVMNEPLPPEFEEDWVTWITRKQTEDGRPPNAEAWGKLESAYEKWNQIANEYWRAGAPPGAPPISLVVMRGEWPSADPAAVFSAKCLEFARELGVFDDAQAWFVAGAPMQPWDLRESHISAGGPVRSVCRALLMMARYDAAANDQDALVIRVQIAMELGKAVASDRHVVAQLVAVAVDRLVYPEIRWLALESVLAQDTTKKLIRFLSIDDATPWQEIIEGEQRITEGVVSPEASFESRSEYVSFDRESRLYWREAVEEAPDSLAALPARSELGKIEVRDLSAVDAMNQQRFLIANSRQMHFIRLLERRGTACLLAIELFHAEQGRLPETLDEAADAAGLSQEMRIDTSAGEPFVYRIEPNAPRGYLLYALGADGIDNGGMFDENPALALTKHGHGSDYNLLAPRPDIKKDANN